MGPCDVGVGIIPNVHSYYLQVLSSVEHALPRKGPISEAQTAVGGDRRGEAAGAGLSGAKTVKTTDLHAVLCT